LLLAETLLSECAIFIKIIWDRAREQNENKLTGAECFDFKKFKETFTPNVNLTNRIEEKTYFQF